MAVEKTTFCFDRLFDYEVIDVDLAKKIKVGCFVAVPFGKNNTLHQAVVVKISNFSSFAESGECKLVDKVLSKEPAISEELLEVAKFLRKNCFCTWFGAIKTILPSGSFFKKQFLWSLKVIEHADLNELELNFLKKLKNFSGFNKIYSSETLNRLILKKPVDEAVVSLKRKGLIFKIETFRRKLDARRFENVVVKNSEKLSVELTKKQSSLLNFIKEFGPINSKEACYKCGVGGSVLKKLESMNLIEFVAAVEHKSGSESNVELKKLNDVVLTEKQQSVVNGLTELLEKQKFCVSLLRGVTGSGKTQVFLKLIEFVLFKKHKQVILLVPEIVLASQIVKFFESNFGEIVTVLHSGLTLAKQFCEHEKIKKGIVRLIIGTRSAVFAPCSNLGLIIMDEEGELTYKESERDPRYHARDVAKFRCFQCKALLLLASATPSIESQYFAKIGRYVEFVLNERFGSAVLPKVFVVDQTKSKSSPIDGVSSILYDELLKNLERKEQSILLLNRRGYNSSVVCLSCGSKVSCPNCSAVLTYHMVNRSLICHYCGYIKPGVEICETCGSKKILYFGQGTQKIEREFLEKFSNAKILRLDSDSIFDRSNLIKKIEEFEQGKYDILIGTQVVAKGLNFFNVTLVGVISIDNMLYGCDFRNSEQMFSLLTQVVGRSGRGVKAGRAFIQTHNPSNSIILKAAAQNYESFYDEEILERKQFLCPPFCDLCVVNFSGFSKEKINLCAKEFILECRRRASVEVPIKVLGIATPFIEKLNRRYRNRVIVKCRNSASFRCWIRKIALKVFSMKIFSGVRVNIDMNGEIL